MSSLGRTLPGEPLISEY